MSLPPKEFRDGLLQFDLGMNSGVAAVLLPKNQLAFAANATVRGTFVKPRPPWFDYQLDFQGNTDTQTAVLNGLWQGGCYALPDSGTPITWGVTAANFVFPAIGATVNITLAAPAPGLTVGTIISFGNGLARAEVVAVISPTQFTIKNLTGTVGGTFFAPVTVFTATPAQGILVAAISGRLFRFEPDPTILSAVVTEVTGGNPQNPTVPQAWLWQAEKWVIWNDGFNLPVFYDLDSGLTSRSNSTSGSGGIVTNQSPVAIAFNTSAPPGTATNATLSGPYIGVVGDTINFNAGTINYVQGVVTAIAGNMVTFSSQVVSGTFVTPVGSPVYSTSATTPPGTQLPPGKMGVYGLGRNWVCLVDGRSFIASDIVGGPSGTAANNYRDAVLNITENNYLVGGGTFRIPLSGGEIRAMIFATTLDASLGQGPLQIFTPSTVFSCRAPVDRLEWTSITNPILTESLIGAGGLGQNNTVNANGDTLFRSLLGVSSLILGRRDVDTWGQVPISREVERIIDRDAENLLPYGSAVIFDNRLLMTCAPTVSALGVYHAGVVAINFDPLSTMQGKKPSCWDGLWPGLNAFQMMTGQFSLVNRCYAFVFEQASKTIALREVLPGKTPEIYDNGTQAIQWTIESPTLFHEPDPAERTSKQLWNGEIWIDELSGTVTFEAFYKPDDYPCWIPWFTWQECAPQNVEGATIQFRPRMGLGMPSSTPCDPTTNRPLREGYYFQFRLVVVGQCRLKGARFLAIANPDPKFAKQGCAPIC